MILHIFKNLHLLSHACGGSSTSQHLCGIVKNSPHHTEKNSEIGDFLWVKSSAFLAQK